MGRQPAAEGRRWKRSGPAQRAGPRSGRSPLCHSLVTSAALVAVLVAAISLTVAVIGEDLRLLKVKYTSFRGLFVTSQ